MKIVTEMLECFEQYSFLNSLFNYKLEKVQVSAIWASIISFVTNAVLVMTGAFEAFSVNILGVGVAFMVMIFVIMLVDLFTGLGAARKREEEIKSKKGLRWVFKFGSYILFIYVLNCFSKESILQGFDWLSYPISIIKIYIMAHIAIWEVKSIDENFESMGYSFSILKMAGRMLTGLTKIMGNKIDAASK